MFPSSLGRSHTPVKQWLLSHLGSCWGPMSLMETADSLSHYSSLTSFAYSLWEFPVMAVAWKASGLFGNPCMCMACPIWAKISQTIGKLLGSATGLCCCCRCGSWLPSGSLKVTQPKVWGFNVLWGEIWPVRNRRLEEAGIQVSLPSFSLLDGSETQSVHAVSLEMSSRTTRVLGALWPAQ